MLICIVHAVVAFRGAVLAFRSAESSSHSGVRSRPGQCGSRIQECGVVLVVRYRSRKCGVVLRVSARTAIGGGRGLVRTLECENRYRRWRLSSNQWGTPTGEEEVIEEDKEMQYISQGGGAT